MDVGAALTVGFFAAQLAVLAVSLYQAAVILAGSLAPSRLPEPPAEDELPRFGVVVCAHDEEPVVAGIIRDLRAQDYPAGRLAVMVVAHNCTDRTADVARAAGAPVVELATAARGKVAAMREGLAYFQDSVDFIGVFDADAGVPRGLVRAVAAAIRGEEGVQVETIPAHEGPGLAAGYGVARRARALLWWRPRGRLGLSTVLTGGGYFMRAGSLRRHLDGLQTMTEDLEITARVVRTGARIAYLQSPAVGVEEPPSVTTSIGQRTRWARGHLAVVRHEVPGLLWCAARGRLRAFDLALYLVAPTRLLTRLPIAAGAILAVVAPSVAAPLWLYVLALAGETVVPFLVVLRGGLVRGSTADVVALARVTILSLLWFPIGVVALVTFWRRDWHRVPRAARAAASRARGSGS